MEKIERAVEILKDLYEGETLHIVGKGPSLQYLRAEHFGDGPVMAMNEAILPVQHLQLANNIFSMQKDGNTASMVSPNDDVALILQTNRSDSWFTDHPMRLAVDPVAELGFEEETVMSIRMCIALGKIMGCARIILISCDALIGDYRTYDILQKTIMTEREGNYAAVVPDVFQELEGMQYEILIPGNL